MKLTRKWRIKYNIIIDFDGPWGDLSKKDQNHWDDLMSRCQPRNSTLEVTGNDMETAVTRGKTAILQWCSHEIPYKYLKKDSALYLTVDMTLIESAGRIFINEFIVTE